MIHTDFLTSPVAQALGWTLLHALWQGFALVLPTALALYLLRSRSSNLRYRLGIGVLLAQVIVTIVTFGVYYESADAVSSATLAPTQLTAVFQPALQPLSWQQQTLFFLENHLSQFVLIYLLGVGLFGLRLAGGWLHLQQLGTSARVLTGTMEQAVVERLRAVLAIQAVVQVRESARIAVPMVVGTLKPMLLLPVGLATGLSARELEAILAHELAHVGRYDYAVNLLQSVVEVMYFFHPALWWLSARVREEREHCCDDRAILVCGDNGRALARALACVEEQRLSQLATPALAMAFASNRQLLLHRVRRALGLSTRPTISNGSLAGLTLATLLLVSASVYAIQQPEKAPAEKPLVIVSAKFEVPEPSPELVLSPSVSIVSTPKVRVSLDTVPVATPSISAERPVVERHESIEVNGKWVPVSPAYHQSNTNVQDTSRIQRAQRQLESLSQELNRIMATRQPMIDRMSKEMAELTLKGKGNQKTVQALQEQQTKLAAQQALLASKQAGFAQKMTALQAEILNLSLQKTAKSRQLLDQKTRQQEQLEKQLDELGTQMGNLGGKMGDIGSQMADQMAPYQERMGVLADSISKLVEPTYAFSEKIAELSGIIVEDANQQAEKAMEMANKAMELNLKVPLDLNINVESPAHRALRKPSSVKYRRIEGKAKIVPPPPPVAPSIPLRPAVAPKPAPAVPPIPPLPAKPIKGKSSMRLKPAKDGSDWGVSTQPKDDIAWKIVPNPKADSAWRVSPATATKSDW